MVLRKYEVQDSKIICSWIKDTKQLYQWSADRIGQFPLNGNELNEYYGSMNGTQPIIPLCAIDGHTVLGHLFIRYPNKDDKTLVRFGFIILSPENRGKGSGKKMVELAIEYAKTVLHASKITLGVFTNNKRARHCYEATGFQPTGKVITYMMPDGAWECIEMELNI